MTVTTRLARLPLTVAVLFAAGCGSKPPRAELLSWRTTREPLKTVLRSQITPKEDGKRFLLVRVRAPGRSLYVRRSKEFEMNCEDFTLVATDGTSVAATGHRGLSDPETFGAFTSTGRTPEKAEEVQILFVVDGAFADRGDLTLRYRDLPELPLDATKKAADR